MDPFETYPVPIHPLLPKKEAVVVEREVGAITLEVVFHGPGISRDEQSSYAADVLFRILNNPTSNFQKNLVDSGLFTQCNLSYLPQNYTGPINIYAETDVDHFYAAKDALMEEIDKFDDQGYFSKGEMDNAMSSIKVERVYDTELTSVLTSGIGPISVSKTIPSCWAISGLDYYLGYIENISHVMLDDLKVFIDNYICTKPFVMGVLISPKDRTTLELKEESLL